MAKSHNQKAKILVLERMLRGTDADRVVTMQEILEQLTEYGIRAERKSIYDDLEALRDFGYDIQFRRGKPGGYYMNENPAADSREDERGTEKDSAAGQAEYSWDEETSEADGAEEKSVCTSGGWHFPEQELQRDSDKKLRLSCSKSREKEVREYFGKYAEYKEKEPGYLTISVPLVSGPYFFGWLTAMGRDVRIVKPRKTAAAYRDYLKVIARDYKGI